jgi:hypothetical protein
MLMAWRTLGVGQEWGEADWALNASCPRAASGFEKLMTIRSTPNEPPAIGRHLPPARNWLEGGLRHLEVPSVVGFSSLTYGVTSGRSIATTLDFDGVECGLVGVAVCWALHVGNGVTWLEFLQHVGIGADWSQIGSLTSSIGQSLCTDTVLKLLLLENQAREADERTVGVRGRSTQVIFTVLASTAVMSLMMV